MDTIKMLKQKIDYWNQKFNEVDEDLSSLPLEFQELKKSQNLSKKGLINLHLRDLEDILTNLEKQFSELAKIEYYNDWCERWKNEC